MWRGGGEREPMTTLFMIVTHPSSMDICRERLYVEGWVEGKGANDDIFYDSSSMDICRENFI